MAAKTGVKAEVPKKPAAAKTAAAPKTPETVEQSAALPGVGAPADNAGTGESEEAKAAREAEEKRLAQEEADEATRLLAQRMGDIEDEARAMDQDRTQRLKTTQTPAEEGATGAVTLTGWALPEISEFPATITLENHTRNRVGIAGANIALAPYEQVEITVSQDQFAALAKALTSSARAHKWDHFKGLQVIYDRKD